MHSFKCRLFKNIKLKSHRQKREQGQPGDFLSKKPRNILWASLPRTKALQQSKTWTSNYETFKSLCWNALICEHVIGKYTYAQEWAAKETDLLSDLRIKIWNNRCEQTCEPAAAALLSAALTSSASPPPTWKSGHPSPPYCRGRRPAPRHHWAPPPRLGKRSSAQSHALRPE